MRKSSFSRWKKSWDSPVVRREKMVKFISRMWEISGNTPLHRGKKSEILWPLVEKNPHNFLSIGRKKKPHNSPIIRRTVSQNSLIGRGQNYRDIHCRSLEELQNSSIDRGEKIAKFINRLGGGRRRIAKFNRSRQNIAIFW